MGRFGPSLSGGSGRSGPRPARVVLAVLVALLALALIAAGAAGALLWYGQAEIQQADIGGLGEPAGRGASAGDDGEEQADGAEGAEGVVNVLVVGSDSREGLSDEELRQLGTERDSGLLTDTIMLVQLDADRDAASVLSFPRDLLVTRCNGSRGRINAAYAIGERDGPGGPTCLVETVTELTGLVVDHYVEVDFAGFIEVVEHLGGVSVWLDEPLEDRYAGVDLEAGCVEMDGATALGYVRSRHADDDGDFGRIRRQQRFLRAVLDETVSMGTLVNVPRLVSLIRSGARAVTTDEDLGLGEMRRLAVGLREIDSQTLKTHTVPGENRRIDGQWLVEVDEEEAEALFAAFRRDGGGPAGLARTAEDGDGEDGSGGDGGGASSSGEASPGSTATPDAAEEAARERC